MKIAKKTPKCSITVFPVLMNGDLPDATKSRTVRATSLNMLQAAATMILRYNLRTTATSCRNDGNGSASTNDHMDAFLR